MLALMINIWVIPVLLMIGVPIIYRQCGGSDTNDMFGIGALFGAGAAIIYALIVWVLYFGIMHLCC
jgi:hypothetical protein